MSGKTGADDDWPKSAVDILERLGAYLFFITELSRGA